MKGPVFTEVGWSSKPLQTELAFKWPLPRVDPMEWKQDIIRVISSVADPDPDPPDPNPDPDPPDPSVFGPPGSGSGSFRLRILRSSSKNSKKNFDFYFFVTSFLLFTLDEINYVKVPSKRNMQKNFFFK
jgi:hypothetical protein